MEELEKLSYMYPSAITIIIVVMALLVLYASGRSLAYVFKTTEEKLKSEPSVLTELDELRTANKQLNYHCDEYRDLINLYKTTVIKRDNRITELEKELSDLRSSCDDSFLNTVDRANQLSLKCASLENIIAEFDVYKKDTQQTYDTLKAEYNNKIAEIDKLNKHIAELEKSLNDAKAQIIGELNWANYVATDKDGQIFAFFNKPFKDSYVWGNSSGKYELISPYRAIILCGREPKWSDANPTPVVLNNPTTTDKHIDLSWVNWIAKDKSGDIWAYAEEPIKIINSWWPIDGHCETINRTQTLSLCDHVPKWEDDEPTYVGKNL